MSKKLVFLIGLPGSGKSTLANYLADNSNFAIISSSTILQEDILKNGSY